MFTETIKKEGCIMGMILYHGSSQIVDRPDTEHSRIDIDFGKGFYLTADERMAKKWAAGKGKAIVNKYNLDIDKINGYKFSLNEEWLDFIKSNRLMEPTDKYDQYDILIGPTADDKLYDTLREYLDGTMTAKEAIKTLNVLGYSNQIVITKQSTLDHLHFLGAKELSGQELQDYRNRIRDDRRMASEKTLELKKRFVLERKQRELNDER